MSQILISYINVDLDLNFGRLKIHKKQFSKQNTTNDVIL